VRALAGEGELPLWATGAADASVRLWDARTPAAAVATLVGCKRRVYVPPHLPGELRGERPQNRGMAFESSIRGQREDRPRRAQTNTIPLL
jgi:hypothetical protein